MRKVFFMFVLLLGFTWTLCAADDFKVNVELSAAFPASQYAVGIIPSAGIGDTLLLKYTFTTTETLTMDSLYKGVKKFFGMKNDPYICCVVNFSGITDVVLAKKTNGIKYPTKEIDDHMILQIDQNLGEMYSYRYYLAAAKNLDMNEWETGIDVYNNKVDTLDSIVSNYCRIERDSGMFYALFLSEFATEKQIREVLGYDFESYGIFGKNYIFLLPFKNKSSYEVEFKLNIDESCLDQIEAEMNFYYFENLTSSQRILENLLSSDRMNYLADSEYYHIINVD